VVSAVYAVPIAAFTGSQLAVQLYERSEREARWGDAVEHALAVGKPLLNIGCGYDPRYVGDVNIDIQEPGFELHPNYVQASIYSIPYPDKYFGAVFVSHVLEHLEDPAAAMSEMDRVADRTYICVPLPMNLLSAFWPGHRWIFMATQAVPNSPAANVAVVAMAAGSGYLIYRMLKKGAEIRL